MKSFNIKRFAQLCKWAASTYRKEYTATVFRMAVMFFILLFIRFNLTWYDGMSKFEIETFGMGCTAMMMFLFCCSGSFLMNNMMTKQQRLMFKLLPASDLEKFSVRYIYITLFWILGCVVAFCIADVLRILLSLITGHGMQATAIPCFLTSLASCVTDINDNNITESILSAEIILFIHSLYLVGGTLFRRRQFVLTSMSIILGMILTAWILSWFHDSFSFSVDEESARGFVHFIMYLLPVLTAVAYRLSYILFRRMQVINNKWINL